jgi:hypothetical protein
MSEPLTHHYFLRKRPRNGLNNSHANDFPIINIMLSRRTILASKEKRKSPRFY